MPARVMHNVIVIEIFHQLEYKELIPRSIRMFHSPFTTRVTSLLTSIIISQKTLVFSLIFLLFMKFYIFEYFTLMENIYI